MTEHEAADARVALAREVRDQAFAELSLMIAHELTTVLHVGQAALDACARGDVVRGHRLLASLCDRARSSLGQLDGYRAQAHEPPAVRLAEVQVSAVTLLRARRPGAPTHLDVSDDIGDTELAVPRSVVCLCLVAAAGAILAAAVPGAAAGVRVWCPEADPEGGMLTVGCGGADAPIASWHVAWAASELERRGGRFCGPLRVAGAGAPAYLISFPTTRRAP